MTTICYYLLHYPVSILHYLDNQYNIKRDDDKYDNNTISGGPYSVSNEAYGSSYKKSIKEIDEGKYTVTSNNAFIIELRTIYLTYSILSTFFAVLYYLLIYVIFTYV